MACEGMADTPAQCSTGGSAPIRAVAENHGYRERARRVQRRIAGSLRAADAGRGVRGGRRLRCALRGGTGCAARSSPACGRRRGGACGRRQSGASSEEQSRVRRRGRPRLSVTKRNCTSKPKKSLVFSGKLIDASLCGLYNAKVRFQKPRKRCAKRARLKRKSRSRKAGWRRNPTATLPALLNQNKDSIGG